MHTWLSIIIPFRDRISLLKETISSINKNNTKGVEVILIGNDVNSASQIEIKELASQHEWITLIFTRNFRLESKNANKARLLGLQKASGEYIMFLDSDDLIQHDFLERVGSSLINSGPKLFVLSSFQTFGENITVFSQKESFIKERDFLLRFFLKQIRIPNGSIIWNRIAFENPKELFLKINGSQDWYLYFALFVKNRNNVNTWGYLLLDEPLLQIRSSASTSYFPQKTKLVNDARLLSRLKAITYYLRKTNRKNYNKDGFVKEMIVHTLKLKNKYKPISFIVFFKSYLLLVYILILLGFKSVRLILSVKIPNRHL